MSLAAGQAPLDARERPAARDLRCLELSAPPGATLDMEARNHTRSGFTEDHLEASKAFVEKRKPEFSGR